MGHFLGGGRGTKHLSLTMANSEIFNVTNGSHDLNRTS